MECERSVPISFVTCLWSLWTAACASNRCVESELSPWRRCTVIARRFWADRIVSVAVDRWAWCTGRTLADWLPRCYSPCGATIRIGSIWSTWPRSAGLGTAKRVRPVPWTSPWKTRRGVNKAFARPRKRRKWLTVKIRYLGVEIAGFRHRTLE